MRVALALLCISVVGCGNSTGTPMAACNSLVSAACNKASACNVLGSTSVSTCNTEGQAALSCSSATCPSGTTYSSAAVNQCISDLDKESCTDVSNSVLPPSCDTSLFCA